MCNCACMSIKLPSNKVKHSRNHTPVLSSGIYSCVVPYYTKYTCIYQQSMCLCYIVCICFVHVTLGEELACRDSVSLQYAPPLDCLAHWNTLVTSLYSDCSLALVERQVSLASTPLGKSWTHTSRPLSTQNHAPCQ